MLIMEHHENQRHFGREKCFNYLYKHYYNPKLKHIVSKVLGGCELCHKSKIGPRLSREMGHVVPKGLNEITYTDLMGPLPISKGGVSYILAIVNMSALKRASEILNCLFNKIEVAVLLFASSTLNVPRGKAETPRLNFLFQLV